MAVESLEPRTQAIIRRVLEFVSTSRHLDGEFETRLGIGRGQLAEILMRWPHADDRADDASATLAINNALNEVLDGFELSADEWQELGAGREAVKAAYVEWASQRGWTSTGLR